MSAPSSAAPPLLEVAGLAVTYRTASGDVEALRGVDLRLVPGEVVALVGESGSGKSTLAHVLLGLLPPDALVTAGRVVFRGEDITRWSDRRLQSIRGRHIGLVPQDPATSLNPLRPVGAQVAEALRVNRGVGRRAAAARAVAILAESGIPDPQLRARQYPHELSGGMCQRVLIGRALAGEPELLVADEPTSGLDVTVQRRVLDHLERATTGRGTTVLLITHDLGVAAERADRIVVMNHGVVVEAGTVDEILDAPADPYTRTLLAAAPSFGPGVGVAGERPVAADRAPAPSTAPVAEPAGEPPAGASPSGQHRDALRVDDLTKVFALGTGQLRAVDGVSFRLPRGSTLGIVGESGSGKSTLGRLVLRLTRPTHGRIVLDGLDVTDLRGEALRLLRRRVQYVSQNPYASLSPYSTVAQIVGEPLRAFGVGARDQRRERCLDLLDQVALPRSLASRRPRELSGGQRQRVALARALALDPDLIVLDEPTSALDVSVQDQLLRLLAALQARSGLSYLFISHDLAVVRRLAHTVGVMRRGRIVELGPTEAVFTRPASPYTEELLAAIPRRRTAQPVPAAGVGGGSGS